MLLALHLTDEASDFVVHCLAVAAPDTLNGGFLSLGPVGFDRFPGIAQAGFDQRFQDVQALLLAWIAGFMYRYANVTTTPSGASPGASRRAMIIAGVVVVATLLVPPPTVQNTPCEGFW